MRIIYVVFALFGVLVGCKSTNSSSIEAAKTTNPFGPKFTDETIFKHSFYKIRYVTDDSSAELSSGNNMNNLTDSVRRLPWRGPYISAPSVDGYYANGGEDQPAYRFYKKTQCNKAKDGPCLIIELGRQRKTCNMNCPITESFQVEFKCESKDCDVRAFR